GAGDDWTEIIESTEFGTITLTLTDEFTLDEDQLQDIATQIIERYLGYFGLYQELQAVVLPVEYSDYTSLRGMGRHGGFVLEITPDQEVDDEFLILFAHEALHSWNGHQLVPDPEADSDTTWFKEGLTHYIALKT